MHINLSSGSKMFTTSNFGDQAAFLDSYTKGDTFNVYEDEEVGGDIKLKKVLKKLKITSAIPANKGVSYYLEFTAEDVDDPSVKYSGHINWK